MKKNTVKKLSKWGEFPQVFQALWNSIDPKLKEQLTAKQLMLLMNNLQQARIDGRTVAGAEVIDSCSESGAVWVDCLSRTIEWDKHEKGLEVRLGEDNGKQSSNYN